MQTHYEIDRLAANTSQAARSGRHPTVAWLFQASEERGRRRADPVPPGLLGWLLHPRLG